MNQHKLTFALILYPLAVVGGLVLFFTPSWMTNDDAAMSMIAHGYGAIATASPNLIFSNIFWGKLIQSIPTIGGWYGYSIATMTTLTLAGIASMMALLQKREDLLLLSLAVFTMLVQAVLFPQFTITAGLITASAVLCLRRFSENSCQGLGWLAAAAMLGILGFLIRANEMLFIGLIAIPLVQWPRALKRLAFWLSGFIFVCVVAFAHSQNQAAYQTQDWAQYNSFMPVAAQLTGWSTGEYLLDQPDLLEKHSLEKIDVELVIGWLWFDTERINLQRFSGILNDVKDEGVAPNWQARVAVALSALFHKDIIYLTLFAVLMLIARPSKAIFCSWTIFLIAIACLGVIGRPGILRVYIPALTLLMLWPFFNQAYYKALGRPLVLLAGVACLALYSSVIFSNTAARLASHQAMLQQLEGLPREGLVAGYYSTFKANHVYSVSGAANLSSKFNNLYLFGWPAIMPNSVAYAAETQNQGFKQQLISAEGVWILINNVELLSKYCKALDLDLETLDKPSGSTGGARRLRCWQI